MSSCIGYPPKEKGHTADALCVFSGSCLAASGGVGSEGHRPSEFSTN